jgi:hypothetical protein
MTDMLLIGAVVIGGAVIYGKSLQAKKLVIPQKDVKNYPIQPHLINVRKALYGGPTDGTPLSIKSGARKHNMTPKQAIMNAYDEYDEALKPTDYHMYLLNSGVNGGQYYTQKEENGRAIIQLQSTGKIYQQKPWRVIGSTQTPFTWNE